MPDGGIVQDALDNYKRQTGEHHPIALKQPPVPAFAYLMSIFSVANRGRTLTQGGWMPIPPSEIESAARLIGITLERWELDGLFRLDDCWRTVMGEKVHSFDDDE